MPDFTIAGKNGADTMASSALNTFLRLIRILPKVKTQFNRPPHKTALGTPYGSAVLRKPAHVGVPA